MHLALEGVRKPKLHRVYGPQCVFEPLRTSLANDILKFFNKFTPAFYIIIQVTF